MNKFYFLFVIVLLGNMACKNEYNNATRHPIEHNHDYHGEEGHDESDHAHGSADHKHEGESIAPIKFNESDLYGSSDRRLWQRPDFIIRRLGNLEGKVVADIGAGPYGYFAFRIVSKTKVNKVIATDIDQQAISYIDSIKTLMLPMDLQGKIEARLVDANNSKLEVGEADVLLMVNTYTYINDRIRYLQDLKEKMNPGGKLYIIDFKKRRLPIGPPTEEKVALYQVEMDLAKAGFSQVESDDQSLDFQYIIEATKVGGGSI